MIRAILYFIVAAVCLWWPAQAIFHPFRKHKKVQKMMMLAMLSLGLMFCALACFSIPALYGKVWTNIAYTAFAALFPYFYYLFIRVLTSTSGIRVRDWLIFIPVGVVIIANLSMNIVMKPDELHDYILSVFNKQDVELSAMGSYRYYFGYWLGRVLIFAEVLAALYYGNDKLKLYHANLENYYSDLKGLADSRNYYTIGYSWISAVTALIVLCSSNLEGGKITLMTIVLIFIAIFLFRFIGKFGYEIEHSTEDLVSQLDEDDKATAKAEAIAAESTPSIDDAEPENPMAKYSKALKKALDEQVYLEQGIELVGLANRIGTNRTYLSNIIHDEYGQNFAEFINSRRIAYAIEMMQNATEQYPVRYVAMKCGYSSLQTFYNNFAKFTGGQTPASYLKH